MDLEHILIIQTAFIGDVILATPLIESIHKQYPHAKIDFLLRKGNESLLKGHPFVNEVIIWHKKKNKYKNLLAVIKQIRHKKYNAVLNLQRFGSTGIITAFSGSKVKVGFKNNPFSFTFSYKISHSVKKGMHETERNLSLLTPFYLPKKEKPVLYPSQEQFYKVSHFKTKEYICAAPTSVWFTKQFGQNKWIEFFNALKPDMVIYLLGAPSDYTACQYLIEKSSNKNIFNLTQQLTLLESAALMKDAKMNFVNDSAPMHLASAVNAPTTAIFCSTVTSFGFGPLSDNSEVIEVDEQLKCRPCGLHGHNQCPKEHFNCSEMIAIEKLVRRVN